MKNLPPYLLSLLLLASCSSPQKVLFNPAQISTPNKTTHEIAFTQDGQTVYYTQTVGDKWGKAQLGFQCSVANGQWGQPVPVEFVDTLYNMSVSPDGNRVLFCKEDKTWLCQKENGQWSVPNDLGADSDYSYLGGYYHIMSDQSFYFSSVQQNEAHPYDDIYYVPYKNGEYQKPQRLNSNINTEATEFSPWVNKKKTVMIFSRYDGKSKDNSGIYISRFENNEWQQAQKIEALKYGWGVFVREDEAKLYYTVKGVIEVFELDQLGVEIK